VDRVPDVTAEPVAVYHCGAADQPVDEECGPG
jgi:hypothetical protein